MHCGVAQTRAFLCFSGDGQGCSQVENKQGDGRGDHHSLTNAPAIRSTKKEAAKHQQRQLQKHNPEVASLFSCLANNKARACWDVVARDVCVSVTGAEEKKGREKGFHSFFLPPKRDRDPYGPVCPSVHLSGVVVVPSLPTFLSANTQFNCTRCSYLCFWPVCSCALAHINT